MLTLAARLVGFAGAAVLAGAPVAVLRARFEPPGMQALVRLAATLVFVSVALSLVGETQVMAGDPAAGADPKMLWTVLSATEFGRALGVRAALALAVLAASALPRPRVMCTAVAILGFGALASFAWTGHGAADSGGAGVVHLTADLAHLAAAGTWIGALVAFLIMTACARAHGRTSDLAAALSGFSGVGTLAVATLILSGGVNAWFLIGPAHFFTAAGGDYGRLLIAKLALFVVMIALAALNRFRLTPALAAHDPAALRALRVSVGLETATGLLILAIVAGLGAMAPPTAQ
jgi:putative copper resistance protein D